MIKYSEFLSLLPDLCCRGSESAGESRGIVAEILVEGIKFLPVQLVEKIIVRVELPKVELNFPLSHL